MNGIVTRPASRLTFSILWMGSCLFGGFALGSKVHNPLKMTTLHFENISWIAERNPIQLAQLDQKDLEQNKLNLSLDFKPFSMPSQKLVLTKSRNKNARTHLNPWARLDRAVKTLKLTSIARPQKSGAFIEENLFADYSGAVKELRRDFIISVVPNLQPSSFASSTAVTTSVSSAMTQDVQTSRNSAAKVLDVQCPQNRQSSPLAVAKMDNQSLAIHKNINNPDPNNRRGISELQIARHPRRVEVSEAKIVKAVKRRESPIHTTPQHESKSAIVSQSAQIETTTSLVQPSEIEIQHEVEANALTGREATAKIPAETHEQKTAETAPQVVAAYFDPGLTKEQQRVLKEALLNEQAKSAKVVMAAPAKIQVPTHTVPATDTQDNVTRPQSYGVSPDAKHETKSDTDPNLQPQCTVLVDTHFINSAGTQVCPVGHTWISRDWNASGWVKVENEGSMPTLAYYPSPNTGTALLLEVPAIAFLGIKTGTRMMKGMGTIVGTLPDGYQVEFAGRAEETETFEVKGQKYFAILNAEPGAGVVQLVSKNRHDEAATVFSPVLEDTITYLDLAAPKAANFTVKVVKNGTAEDPEVVGLTVGVSTQGKIQGITQSQGRAFLRNVPTIPGYPVYIDVSSKMETQRGYTYRYLLKNRNHLGEYVVQQVAEKTLFHWIKQVKQGLSDQSAMLVGFYNRKKLGGFKEHYFVKADPQTTKSGLEPLNYSILWDGRISTQEPLEGDQPRFMSVQIPEGLTQVKLIKESGEMAEAELIPVSPRVIHVVSE